MRLPHRERSTVDVTPPPYDSSRRKAKTSRGRRTPPSLPYHSIRSGQQGVTLQNHSKVLLSIKTAELDWIISQWHEGDSAVQQYFFLSYIFSIDRVVKQGCIRVPTLFWIIFVLLLKHAFSTSTGGIFQAIGSISLASKRRPRLTRHSFGDNAAVTTHTHTERIWF